MDIEIIKARRIEAMIILGDQASSQSLRNIAVRFLFQWGMA